MVKKNKDNNKENFSAWDLLGRQAVHLCSYEAVASRLYRHEMTSVVASDANCIFYA
jgi:hypothetical protein